MMINSKVTTLSDNHLELWSLSLLLTDYGAKIQRYIGRTAQGLNFLGACRSPKTFGLSLNNKHLSHTVAGVHV